MRPVAERTRRTRIAGLTLLCVGGAGLLDVRADPPPAAAGSGADEPAAAAQVEATGIEERVRRLERLAHEERARRGARIYARSCAACHGRDGRGDGPGAADLDPAPRDLAAGGVRYRSTSTGAAPRREDVARTIRHGLPGSAMPAFGDLFSEGEIEQLIDHIDALRGGEISRAPQPLEIADPALPDAASIEEGRAVYLVTGCWSCHGLDGAGRGPAAGGLADERERPLRMPDFRHDPLKGGREARAIVRTLRTGLNGAPMPSFDEAMLFAAEDFQDPATLPVQLDERDRGRVSAYLRGAPRRADLAVMDEASLLQLRDRRLAALAHYVLSLDRRSGLRSRLFHERPELNPRKRR